jgi:ferredoxin
LRTAPETAHIIAASVGFTSYVLLWLTVVWGIILRSGWALTRVKHGTIYGTHMTMSMLGLILGVVHTGAQISVGAGTVGAIDMVVPFTNKVDPIGIGFGVIALEVMISLAVSVLLQRKLGYSRWRGLHSFAYLAFTLLAAHLLISGSEVSSIVFVWVPVVITWVTAVVVWMATTRQGTKIPRKMGERAGDRLRAQQATVNVDPNTCVRFGFCEHEAPEVFQLRSDGRLAYQPTVPDEQIDAVIQAARVCPARAIMLTRQPTTVLMAAKEPPEREEAGIQRPTRLSSRRGSGSGSSRHGGA